MAVLWRRSGSHALFGPRSINRSNVKRLKPAWIHHTGDALQRPATQIQCTPLVIDNVMYLTTARLQVRSLDAATGEVKWNFNPYAGERLTRARGVSRGLTSQGLRP